MLACLARIAVVRVMAGGMAATGNVAAGTSPRPSPPRRLLVDRPGQDDAILADRRRWAVALLLVAALLACWPALWNGFPILMGDSNRYIEEALGHPSWVSSQYYGYFLRLFRGTTVWLPILVQALAATAVPWLFVRRAVGLGAVAASATTAAAMLVTPLPFFASLVMTDVWFGLGVLAAVTLALGRGTRPVEQAGLAGVTAFSAAAHPAALPLIAAIVIVAAMVAAVRRRRHGTVMAGVLWASAGVAVALVALVVNNLIVWDTPSPNPHSAVVAFAYLLTNGDLEDELAACDDTPACQLDGRPVANANGFNRFLFRPTGALETRLGGPEAFVDEATEHVLTHVRSDPGQYLARVLSTARQQLTHTDAWGHSARLMERLAGGHVDRFERYASADAARLAGSRQYHQELTLGWHHPVGVAAGLIGVVTPAALAAVAWRRRRRQQPADRTLHVTLVLGLQPVLYVAHAVLIGTTTFAVARYGGRMLWLLGLGGCAAVAWAATGSASRVSRAPRSGSAVPTRSS